MKARKLFTWLGIIGVTVVAGLISYRHQSELALHNGQPRALAAVWPACVDGLVMACGIAIATDRAGGYRPRWWALIGFWLGVGVSVLTNWLATSGGVIAHGVSAFPAVAFLIAVESLSAKPGPRKADTPIESLAAESPAPLPSSEPPAVTTVDATKPAAVTPAPASGRRPRKAPPATTAAAKVASAAKRMPAASAAQIAARVGVSESTARRHLAALGADSVASSFEPTPAQSNGHDVLAEVAL